MLFKCFRTGSRPAPCSRVPSSTFAVDVAIHACVFGVTATVPAHAPREMVARGVLHAFSPWTGCGPAARDFSRRLSTSSMRRYPSTTPRPSRSWQSARTVLRESVVHSTRARGGPIDSRTRHPAVVRRQPCHQGLHIIRSTARRALESLPARLQQCTVILHRSRAQVLVRIPSVRAFQLQVCSYPNIPAAFSATLCISSRAGVPTPVRCRTDEPTRSPYKEQ